MIFRSSTVCGYKASHDEASRIVEVTWKEPPSEWMKANIDDATFGSPRLFGCVSVFQTTRFFVKECFSILLGVSYSFEVELAATIYAMMYATTFV